MPAPTSRNASGCSNRTASMPRCLSASAVVMPPMPPPAIRILRSCLIKIPPDGLPAVAPTAAISRIATHSEPGATVTATSVRPVPADPPSPEHREFHACRGGGVVNCFTIGLQIRSCGQLHRAARSGPPGGGPRHLEADAWNSRGRRTWRRPCRHRIAPGLIPASRALQVRSPHGSTRCVKHFTSRREFLLLQVKT
jgi:hypothetical protein